MCGRGKSFDRKPSARLRRNTSHTKFFQDRAVISWITYQCDTFMILRCGTDEGYAADVNVFDCIGIGDIRFGNGLFKGIEVHGNEINIVPTKIKKLLVIFFCRSSEQSAMNRGMERLDTSTEDFGRFSVICNFGHREVVVTQ